MSSRFAGRSNIDVVLENTDQLLKDLKLIINSSEWYDLPQLSYLNDKIFAGALYLYNEKNINEESKLKKVIGLVDRDTTLEKISQILLEGVKSSLTLRKKYFKASLIRYLVNMIRYKESVSVK